jgi:PAS domain-containing protein
MRWLAREIDTFVAYLRSGAKASLGVGDTTADPFQRQLADLVHLHSSEAMMVTDPQHRITLVNPAFIRMTGMPPRR